MLRSPVEVPASPGFVCAESKVYLNIDPDKFDGELGKLWQEGKSLRWKNELNLAEIDFFSKDKKSQVNIIEEFLKQSYNYSMLLEDTKSDE